MTAVGTPPHWWRPGDPLIAVTSRWETRQYPACLHEGCLLPVATMTGSPLRLYGLGTGWTTYECADGHRYAYQPQGREISHVSARIDQ
jgi:hypothetical protein